MSEYVSHDGLFKVSITACLDRYKDDYLFDISYSWEVEGQPNPEVGLLFERIERVEEAEPYAQMFVDIYNRGASKALSDAEEKPEFQPIWNQGKAQYNSFEIASYDTPDKVYAIKIIQLTPAAENRGKIKYNVIMTDKFSGKDIHRSLNINDLMFAIEDAKRLMEGYKDGSLRTEVHSGPDGARVRMED